MKSATLIATVSATPSKVSPAFDLGDLTVYGVGVAFTGADVAGTLTLESCNSGNDADFVTVANSSQAVSLSADHFWSVSGAGYRYVRVRWAYTSGTGNITADINAKENRVVGG